MNEKQLHDTPAANRCRCFSNPSHCLYMYAPVIFLIESLFMIYIKPQIKYSKLIGDNIPFIHLFFWLPLLRQTFVLKQKQHKYTLSF